MQHVVDGQPAALDLDTLVLDLRRHCTSLESADLSGLSETLAWVSSLLSYAHQAVALHGVAALSDTPQHAVSRWLLTTGLPRAVSSMWCLKYPSWAQNHAHALFKRFLAIVADVVPFVETCPAMLSAAHLMLGACCVAWCCVAWCGVVWCGVVWRGVVWCGVVWCGVVWCGAAWCRVHIL